jgi:hypothetical protein
MSFIFQSFTDNVFLQKPLINDHYNYIAINEIKMWVSNNGNGSNDPNTGHMGFFWPGGLEATKTPVFQDGLLWGGYIDDSLHVNGSYFWQGLQAGKILPDGNADDPNLSKYRVYKIRKDWESLPYGPERNAYEIDYHEWPVGDGAPWIDLDGDSIYTPGVDEPKFSGDEMLWYVANDKDSVRSKDIFGSDPIGIEIQVTTYAYKPDWLLGDVIFKKYLIINKGNETVEDMILSYWIDHDLGDYSDDYVGGDSLLDLGFGYNGDNEDGDGKEREYGTPPPAVGYHILQGPVIPSSENDSAYYMGMWNKGLRNLSMTSFAPIVKGWRWWGITDAGTGEEMYNNMRGYVTVSGRPVVDPNSGDSTIFALCGDPVAGTGWYEGPGWPGGWEAYDRRMQVNSGPFTFAPGDTNEIVFAIIMAIGDDYLDSITELKRKVRAIREFYYTGIMSSINGGEQIVPIKYSLSQNYPNPFNPITTIEFTLPISDKVQLDVFNITGQKVETLINKRMRIGKHTIEFNARKLASGVYFYQIEAGSFRDVKKMIVIK